MEFQKVERDFESQSSGFRGISLSKILVLEVVPNVGPSKFLVDGIEIDLPDVTTCSSLKSGKDEMASVFSMGSMAPDAPFKTFVICFRSSRNGFIELIYG